MKTLKEYLDGTDTSEDLKEVIMLITSQGGPIRDAFITNQTYVGTENASGEEQAEMDVWSDSHITSVLKRSGLVKQLASEEKDDILEFPDAKGDLAVVMDPLDGSSLIQVNLAVGTIVGVYRNDNALQKGDDMAAAFYMLYGPMTTLTLTVGEGVYIFAMDKKGAYIMLKEDVKIPEGNLYGIGGLKIKWTKEHARIVDGLEKDGFKLRYSGSFVADFHQILRYGGLFAYPALEGKPDGKLRLVFEANPIGFIAKQAGGRISNGSEDLLKITPDRPHHRTPIYVGSKGVIERIEREMSGA